MMNELIFFKISRADIGEAISESDVRVADLSDTALEQTIHGLSKKDSGDYDPDEFTRYWEILLMANYLPRLKHASKTPHSKIDCCVIANGGLATLLAGNFNLSYAYWQYLLEYSREYENPLNIVTALAYQAVATSAALYSVLGEAYLSKRDLPKEFQWEVFSEVYQTISEARDLLSNQGNYALNCFEWFVLDSASFLMNYNEILYGNALRMEEVTSSSENRIIAIQKLDVFLEHLTLFKEKIKRCIEKEHGAMGYSSRKAILPMMGRLTAAIATTVQSMKLECHFGSDDQIGK